MKGILYLAVILFTIPFSGAQELPQDFLSANFHKERRQAVRAMMPENSVAVFFTNPVRNRANDVDYHYHQDPDFYYLTGYREPNAVLLLFSEGQTDAAGNTFDEVIFVQKRDPYAEMWNGKRLGIEGVTKELGFEYVKESAAFLSFDIDYKAFNKVLFYNFNNDYRNSLSNDADLFDLIRHFRGAVDYPADFNPVKHQLYTMIKSTDVENSANVAQVLGRYLNYYKELQSDEILSGYVASKDDAVRKELKEKVQISSLNNLDAAKLGEIMNTLRETKTAEEMKLLTKAIEMSAIGQIEVMKAMKPNMSETEIQGIHEFVYKKYGAEYEGYPSIVGAGHNGCILHYIDNNKPMVGNDLVLMDLGAEYHGYTADVTRTIPANGKFSTEQKLIYDLVYDAQEAGIKASVVGAPFIAPEQAARKVIHEGLVKLGIAKNLNDARQYFPHGTSHYLGLDVHDKGTYGNFKENTVITVEPGIYIPEGSDCDEKWWRIAVRIEDDILITNDGPVNLSGRAPRKSEEIEKLMAQSSALDDFVLPKLD